MKSRCPIAILDADTASDSDTDCSQGRCPQSKACCTFFPLIYLFALSATTAYNLRHRHQIFND
jgi:hypothetical protein